MNQYHQITKQKKRRQKKSKEPARKICLPPPPKENFYYQEREHLFVLILWIYPPIQDAIVTNEGLKRWDFPNNAQVILGR